MWRPPLEATIRRIRIKDSNTDETHAHVTNEFEDPLNWLVTRTADGLHPTFGRYYVNYTTVMSYEYEQL